MSKKPKKQPVKTQGFRQPDSVPRRVEFRAENVTHAVEAARPWFSFRHICQRDYCVKKCSIEKMKSYSDKLRILSDLDWKSIESSPKETNGFELIPVRNIRGVLPEKFSRCDNVWVFRFGGGGRVASKTSGRIAGIRENERFFVLFVDRDFTLYDHGS